MVSAIEPLSDEDRVLDYGGLGNFSLSGFEMVIISNLFTPLMVIIFEMVLKGAIKMCFSKSLT